MTNWEDAKKRGVSFAEFEQKVIDLERQLTEAQARIERLEKEQDPPTDYNGSTNWATHEMWNWMLEEGADEKWSSRARRLTQYKLAAELKQAYEARFYDQLDALGDQLLKSLFGSSFEDIDWNDLAENIQGSPEEEEEDADDEEAES